jgi:hypothetical protein
MDYFQHFTKLPQADVGSGDGERGTNTNTEQGRPEEGFARIDRRCFSFQFSPLRVNEEAFGARARGEVLEEYI